MPSGVSHAPVAAAKQVARSAAQGLPAGTSAGVPRADSGAGGETGHDDVLHRLRREQEQSYRLITHPF
jgi:hypothetical protein